MQTAKNATHVVNQPATALELAEEIVKLKTQVNDFKSVFDRLDSLVEQLAGVVEPGLELVVPEQFVMLPSGKAVNVPQQYFRLVDNFADHNTAFKSVPFKRFDVAMESVAFREYVEKEELSGVSKK